MNKQKLIIKNSENKIDVLPMFVFISELEDKTDEDFYNFFSSVIKQDLRQLLIDIIKRIYSIELVSKVEKYLDELEEYLESELN